MSTEDNKALVRRFIEEGWNQRNSGVFDELLAPDYISHTPDGDFQGLEGYKQLYNAYVTAFPDCHFTVDDLVAEGDKVSMSYTFTGTHDGQLQDVAPTGKRVTVSGVFVGRIVGGKAVEDRTVWDTLGLMRQIGAVS